MPTPPAAATRAGSYSHWLCANDAVTAEMLLVLIEADEDDDGVSSAADGGRVWAAARPPASARGHVTRALELLIDANPPRSTSTTATG